MEPAKVQNDHTSDHISSPENDHQREKSTDDDNTGVGRSYECTFCKRGFTNAQALGGHMNIHRKDKAKVKLQNKNQGGGPSKLLANDHQDYSNLRYFPQIPSSDHQQQQEIGGYISRPAVNYQVYLPAASNPNFQTANYFPGWRPDSTFEGHLDANLGLSIGQPEGGDGDLDVKKNEVDLELRLGHNIDR